MARLKTNIKALTKWSDYMYKLSMRRLDYGKSNDGKTTEIHDQLEGINHKLRMAINNLRMNEQRAAKRSLFERAFSATKGDPKLVEAALHGAINNVKKAKGGSSIPSNSKPKRNDRSNGSRPVDVFNHGADK